MTTYFLRTVSDSMRQGSAPRERLDAAVRNTGNHFFESAVSRQLADYETLHDIDDLPPGADHLVLSMSNFLSPATDMGEFAQRIEGTGVSRLTMIGAGAQADSYDHRIELAPGTRRFISLLAERSVSIGVRGFYTAEFLAGLGIHNVDVIGCPSLFFGNDRDLKIVKRDLGAAAPRTVVHCTPLGYYRDAVSHLLSFAIRECEGYVAQSETALLFDGEGEASSDFFFQYYNDGEHSPEESQRWMREHVRWFFDLDSWFDYMARMEFSVGARFHGNMAALQVGVPALNLVCDSRTRELCEYLNLPFEFFKDFDGRRSAAQLYEQTDYSLFNATYASRYDAYRNFLEKNGLAHRLVAAPPRVCDPRQALLRDSLIELVRSCEGAEIDDAALARELLLRIKRDRSEAVMKLAEAGRFDLRTAPDAAV